MKNIDKSLEKYKPGHPKMKPDVLKQTEELKIEREKMQKEMAQKQQGQGQILLEQPGQAPRPLTTQEVAGILDKQNKELNERGQRLQTQERLLHQFRNDMETLKAENEALKEQIKEMESLKEKEKDIVMVECP